MNIKQPPHPHEKKRNKPALPTAVAKFQRYCRAARKELGLANTYLDDGALATGAAQLRRAADLFDRANKTRNDALYKGR